jgi:hypothetical protein
MGIASAKFLGGFVRWLLKGCKTKLDDEIHGRLDPKWLDSYDTENYIIGLITSIIMVVIAMFVVL